MKASEVARAAGVSAHTIRFYQRMGLLKADKDDITGYHQFSTAHVAAVNFIRRAQSLGLTLEEVGLIFKRAEQHRSPCPEVREMVRRRLPEVEAKIAELTRLSERMRRALKQWQQMSDGIPTGTDVCRLIESMGKLDLT